MKFFVHFLLSLLPILSHHSVQGNRPYSWNQLRGPNGSGFLKDSRPPIKIEKHIAWKTVIPSGLSSPALSEKKIFLTAIDKGRLVTLALDKSTGKIVWNRKAPEVPIEKFHKASSPATSVPTGCSAMNTKAKNCGRNRFLRPRASMECPLLQ